MTANYKIDEHYDDSGALVFFITRNGVHITSRWTREDADKALARLIGPTSEEPIESSVHAAPDLFAEIIAQVAVVVPATVTTPPAAQRSA